MKAIKVRKIGNSIGIILPRESGLTIGDELTYYDKGNQLILDKSEINKAHDRALIEKGFYDFEKGLFVSKAEMKQTFGKYGWR